jgi:serine/threonine protein kinase
MESKKSEISETSLDAFEVKFDEESKLGYGGFGFVYRGTHKATGKQCAIKKFIKSGFSLMDSDLLSYKRHIDFLSSLSHPLVIKMLGTFQDDEENLYLVTDLATEGDLDDYIKKVFAESKDLPKDYLRYFVMIILAIQFLHSKDIIHRDIKPANFLLSKDKQGRIVVKVSDFDVAKDARAATVTDTQKGTYSPAYSSP